LNAGERAGLRTFLLVWLGQSVSLVGSQLAGFGLGVWLYQRTGSTTLYSLVALANVAPLVLIAPLAGVVIDRWDRRLALLAGQAGAGACALLMAALFQLGALDPWAILLCVTLASTFGALHLPAFSATTTTLISPRHLGRANGLVQIGIALAQIGAPSAGGLLLHTFGLGAILGLDVATFLFALGVLLGVRIPRPTATAEGRAGRGSTWHEAMYGFRYLRERPGLLGLLLFSAAVNFTLGMVEVLIAPLVLGFTDSRALGTILSVGGVGMLVGSGVMLAWGGPRRCIHGMLGFILLETLFLLVAAARPSVRLVAIAAFGMLFVLPLIAGCSETIWQRKIPLDLQGRVFSARSAVAGVSLSLSFLLAGPLYDRVAGPLMAQQGLLAPSVGRLLGTGSGRGAALLLVVLSSLTLVSVAVGYLYPPLRRMEEDLPVCATCVRHRR
jgi:MFS transporter, DHA3 family, macrolide efflux protein